MGLLVVLVLAVVLVLVILLPTRLLSRYGPARNAAGTKTGQGSAGGDEPVARHAIESPAVVRQVWEHAGTTNHGPRIGMVLSVEPEQGEAFVVEVEQTLARGQAGRIRPGHVVTVRYRPADPTGTIVVGLN